MSEPIVVEVTSNGYVLQVEDIGEIQTIPIDSAINVEGVQIPSPGPGSLDDLSDVEGAELGLAGQVLTKGIDGVWRPAAPSGGGGDSGLTFVQNTPAASWLITHGLGRFPQVTAVDSSGNRVLPDLHYDSLNAVTLVHAAPLAGAAYLI